MTGHPRPGEPEPHGDADTGDTGDTGDVDSVADDQVDEASEESFPASDAPASWSGPSDA